LTLEPHNIQTLLLYLFAFKPTIAVCISYNINLFICCSAKHPQIMQ
jgi:hypothetical protein